MLNFGPRPGRYFATFGADGAPLAFWHEAVHGFRTRLVPRHVEPDDLRQFPRVDQVEEPNADCLIPADAQPITDEQWAAYVTTLEQKETA